MQPPPTKCITPPLPYNDDNVTLQDEQGEAVEYELSGDSFLNHAARNLPSTMLGWHYRSRSESLISFSNRAFYAGRLLSVPEVALPAPGLREIKVGHAEEGDDNVARVLDRAVGF